MAAACSGGGSEAAHTTVPAAAPSTTSADPYAVPPTIDAAYVNRVLAALDAAVGDVVRMVKAAGFLTPDTIERLKAVYADEVFESKKKGLEADARRSFAGVKETPGNRRSTVTQLIQTTGSCLFARVARDYRDISDQVDPALNDQWIGLKPLPPGRDSHQYNPTPWIYVYDGFPEDHSQPANPCDAS